MAEAQVRLDELHLAFGSGAERRPRSAATEGLRKPTATKLSRPMPAGAIQRKSQAAATRGDRRRRRGGRRDACGQLRAAGCLVGPVRRWVDSASGTTSGPSVAPSSIQVKPSWPRRPMVVPLTTPIASQAAMTRAKAVVADMYGRLPSLSRAPGHGGRAGRVRCRYGLEARCRAVRRHWQVLRGAVTRRTQRCIGLPPRVAGISRCRKGRMRRTWQPFVAGAR
jgi:hypothetical protein